jgi:hypothetical protein
MYISDCEIEAHISVNKLLKMHVKKGNLNVNTCVTPKAKAAVVAVSFKCPGDYWLLQYLKYGHQCECAELPKGAESTALAYSVFEKVKPAVLGNVAEEVGNQVFDVTCNLQDGEFIIYATCAPSLTAARKAAGNILKNMSPHSNWASYSDNLKLLAAKPKVDKGVFVHCAKDALKSMTDITVVLGGKIKFGKKGTETTVLNKTVGTLLKKSVMGTVSYNPKTVKVSPPSSKGAVIVDGVSVSLSGLDAVVAQRYVEAKLRSTVHIVDKKLVLTENSMTAMKVSKTGAKKTVAAYLKAAKWGKLGTELTPAMVFIAMKNGELSGSELVRSCNKKVSVSDVLTNVSKALLSAK